MGRWFTAPLTTLAFCWRLDRSDGVTLGLTSHDQPLVFAGLLYHAAPGMLPSALEQFAAPDTEMIELSGALSSHVLRADDLVLGRWDGARLRLWAVDWTAPDADPLCLARGQLGAVTVADGKFTVALEGPVAALDAPVTEATTPHCRAQLGDTRCRVDMAGRVARARITGGAGTQLSVDRPLEPGAFAFGRLRWADGPRAGLSALILANDAQLLTLAGLAEGGQAAGMVELTQGCDRRFATCCTRFANAANFRGEPHVPGQDLLVRYGE